jgi:hypothetical protein
MLHTTTVSLFTQIEQSLAFITNEEYTANNQILSNVTLGQHLRHIIELFQEMLSGLENGTINYENRKRDYTIECDKNFATKCLAEILKKLPSENKASQLVTDYGQQYNDTIVITTSYYREWIYNIEHTIHHMALMRIVLENNLGVSLPTEYGVAASTIKYRSACAQ